ncbi:hypothetical protein ACFX12_014059 [Malus domestica]
MGLLSNRVDKGSLKPGDHIYSWRTAYIYAHHVYGKDGNFKLHERLESIAPTMFPSSPSPSDLIAMHLYLRL